MSLLFSENLQRKPSHCHTDAAVSHVQVNVGGGGAEEGSLRHAGGCRLQTEDHRRSGQFGTSTTITRRPAWFFTVIVSQKCVSLLEETKGH